MSGQRPTIGGRALARREWLRTVAGATVGGTMLPGLVACGGGSPVSAARMADGRIQSRPVTPIRTPVTGLQPLGTGGSRDGLCFIPSTYTAARPLPLVMMFHGATGTATGGIAPFLPLAESASVVLLVPDSRQFSWDIRFGAFGPDVQFIEDALTQLYLRCAIDPARQAMAGFSDGASYALSLGLTNGDVFGRIVAFSPGFESAGQRRGTPRVFISHGASDGVLSIEQTSRVIVPRLRAERYDVTYREFAGGHGVPATIAADAMQWLSDGWA